MVIPQDFEQFRIKALKKQTENKKFFGRLKKKKSKDIVALFEATHEEVFACTDCLKCANCCKTTGPLFTQKDIERISSHLKMKPGDFVEKYLCIDEDKDYVLKQVPCVFLGSDNYCSIYDVRPKACREYPHTDTPYIPNFFNLTAKNTLICPAAFEIVERIKKAMP